MIVDIRSVSRWLAASAAITACAISSTEAFRPMSQSLSTSALGPRILVPNLRLATLANVHSKVHTNVHKKAPLTVMFRIRCENKYYQLEELEDADNCTTELFLKEDGTVDVMETDGPLFSEAVGNWEIKENNFAMSITKTFKTGTDNKKDTTGMGEFSFEVERVFEGEMTVVGGTEVAINGRIFAEDIITSKMDKEVGFFNMIDGTEVRLERRPDARPKNIGVVPSPIDSNDVKGHDGIPKEWLEQPAQPQPQIDPALSAFGGGGFGQDAQGYGGGGYQAQEAPASNWGSGSGSGAEYGQQQPSEQQSQPAAGISDYGNPSTFGQESQGYGGSNAGYGQQQHGAYDPGPSFSDYENYYGQDEQQQQQQPQEGEYYTENGSEQQQGDGGGGGTSWDDYYNSQGGGYTNGGGGGGVTPMGGGSGPNPWP